ncbi:MAG TPA: hypothetical protein VK105_18170 [Virgibacillus sp.]|nr:hypothetical protein [Virgibacillus sp.]HLR69014.1 hypothetical protein [Virgibacillus sp.]
MSNPVQQENQQAKTFEATKKQPSTSSKKSASYKKKKLTKPAGFKEFETLAKEILGANDGSYYEWLHKQHQDIILNFNVHNQKQITEVANQS